MTKSAGLPNGSSPTFSNVTLEWGYNSDLQLSAKQNTERKLLLDGLNSFQRENIYKEWHIS